MTVLKRISLLLACIACFSCDDNTEEAIQWINSHPKPIVVTFKSINGITNAYRYTLTDSLGEVKYFDGVQAKLPDTINIYGK